MLSVARDFYERAWSLETPTDEDLAPYLCSNHVQRDMVWQAGRESVGRRAMSKGMRHMRRAVYPDLRFSVEKVAAAADAGKSVFVEWVFRGTFEGREDVARGVTVFDFANDDDDDDDDDGDENDDGESDKDDNKGKLKIARSSVYRQALPAEVDLARRSKKGEVAEGVLLE